MSDFLFAPVQASVAIQDSDKKFPVRRIYCVGRNYAAHIKEMGGDERALPFFFQKPSDAVVASGTTIPYPSQTKDLQHEIELVLAIGRQGADIPADRAAQHVFGLAVGIDLTRRDLQGKAKDTGKPWESGKAFDQSAPISAIHPLKGALPAGGRIALKVNGVTKQEGDLKEMIWNCAEIISHLSALFALMPGDLIYTGTPSGVGPIVSGDKVEGTIEGIDRVTLAIA
jgi:fumarylpyruvate hydrolase